ncbi:MAG: teichoic acid ABC transporter ATP-binding protein [Euryarchaeota archaeon]|nr:teichoic acid ABC transporter ATP-binding protein [Euryarchaeota archaeon]|tara:strand:+ start:648 stop:1421 length:774 start_codon:yes stop_codon:yes gene_type:complete
MKEIAIKVDNVSLIFSLSDSGPKQIFRTFFGPLGKKIFGNGRSFTALRDIDFELRKGEVLGLIGNNGSGKSTLLQCMAGIYRPNKGTVYSKEKPFLLAGVGMGYSSRLTGRENILLLGSILGIKKKEIAQKIPELVEFAELEEWIDEPLRTYSSGMNARLGMAGIAYFRPDVLLIDEVLGVGDPTFKEKSKEKIMEMVEEASTVVMASHSFNLLIDICDRIIFLEKGKIKAIGDPQDVVDVYYGRKESDEVAPLKRK